MKRLCHIVLLLALLLQGCTAFRAIKCGDPSVDTYLNFALDTIKAADNANSCLITAADHDRWFEERKFTGARFHSETLDEYFARYADSPLSTCLICAAPRFQRELLPETSQK